ncbi:MAG: peptidylprolyl isomerase [Vulcanimicrobiaceae bacterium]
MKSFVAIFGALVCLGASVRPGGDVPVDVRIATTLGAIVVRLDARAAPRTTANFLHYVDARAYDGTSFYRTVARRNEPRAPFEVIQGGLGPHGGNRDAAIRLEPTNVTGLHNGDGAIAMARTNDPDSATTEFFLDVGDARYLDAGGPLGPGYAVFGRVVAGMAVVRRIHAARASGEALTPPIGIASIRRTKS